MNLADAGLAVSYQLDLFGRLRRGAEAAGATADSSASLLEAARISAVAGVVRSYMTACHAGEELAIAEHSLAIQQRQLEVASCLLAGGRGNEVDVARARAQVETLRAELPPFEAKKAAALYRLAALLGHTPGELPEAAAACNHAPQLSQPIPLATAPPCSADAPTFAQPNEAGRGHGTDRRGHGDDVPTDQSRRHGRLHRHARTPGDAVTQRWAFGPSISWHVPTQSRSRPVRAMEPEQTPPSPASTVWCWRH